MEYYDNRNQEENHENEQQNTYNGGQSTDTGAYDMTQSAAQQSTYTAQQSTYADPYGASAAAAAPQPEKKGKGGIIAGIAVAACAVIAAVVVVVLFLTGVIGGEKMPGYYKISGLTVEGEKYTSREVRDMNAYIVLDKDGTGWLYYKRDVKDLTWDDQAITLASDKEKLSYVLEDGVLTVGDPDETEYVFTRTDEDIPDKPAPRPDISEHAGVYYLVEADGTVCAEGAGSIEIYADYTALVDLNLSDTVEFDMDRRTITFLDYGGEDIDASIRSGVIEGTFDGETCVFARESSDRYTAWQEALNATSAGYYTLKRMGRSGDWIDGADIRARGGEVYLALKEDGTGYLVADYTGEVEVFDLMWDEERIYPTVGISYAYTVTDGLLTMSEGDITFELEYAGGEEEAPERPQSTGEINGTVSVVNMMDKEIAAVWVSDAGSNSWGTRSAAHITPDLPIVEVSLPDASYFHLYDIRFELEDGTGYYIYEVMLNSDNYLAIDYNDNHFEGFGDDYDKDAEYMLMIVDMDAQEILAKYTFEMETEVR